MTPDEFAGARRTFDMGRREFGALLGYTGDQRNIWLTVKRYENGERVIPPTIARLVTILRWFHDDYGYVPDLDSLDRAVLRRVDGYADAR